jgi:hypothetical protein
MFNFKFVCSEWQNKNFANYFKSLREEVGFSVEKLERRLKQINPNSLLTKRLIKKIEASEVAFTSKNLPTIMSWYNQPPQRIFEVLLHQVHTEEELLFLQLHYIYKKLIGEEREKLITYAEELLKERGIDNVFDVSVRGLRKLIEDGYQDIFEDYISDRKNYLVDIKRKKGKESKALIKRRKVPVKKEKD